VTTGQAAINRKIRAFATISVSSTAVLYELLHECRTYRRVPGPSPLNHPAKRKNDFAGKALREGLPYRPHYDRDQSGLRFDWPKVIMGYELPLNSAPLAD
jgi:hypothetical protein